MRTNKAAELLYASGLVAAVVAGIIIGIRVLRVISPFNRPSDYQNWRMVDLIPEGAVFLMMGLQVRVISTDVERDGGGISTASLIADGASVIAVVVRAAFVAPLLRVLSRQSHQHARMNPRMEVIHNRLNSPSILTRSNDADRTPVRSERYRQEWERWLHDLSPISTTSFVSRSVGVKAR